jgi:hypothetical protein
MTVPTYLPYFVLVSGAAVVGTLVLGLRVALRRAGWSSHERRRVVGISALILLGWLGVALAFAVSEAYRGAPGELPTIQFGILAPILIGSALIVRSSTMARVIEAVPQQWLIGVQLYRALGVIFLILYGAGQMPGLFAWPAGVGDVLVGALAPIVAIAYARGPEMNRDLAWAWNILGLTDLGVAVATGMITAPSPIQQFAFDLPNELVGAFPLILIPTYLVPLSALLHFASLTKLRRTAQAPIAPALASSLR